MNELTEDISWVTIIVSFVLSYFLQAVWYNPRHFGKKWTDDLGISFNAIPVLGFITQALGIFFLAWLVGITVASNSFLLITLILVTIILFVAAIGKLSQKSNTAVAIEAGCIFAMGVVMLVCQLIFKYFL